MYIVLCTSYFVVLKYMYILPAVKAGAARTISRALHSDHMHTRTFALPRTRMNMHLSNQPDLLPACVAIFFMARIPKGTKFKWGFSSLSTTRRHLLCSSRSTYKNT